MAVKKVYLDFEIHLNDAARVAELQANPPGETSIQNGHEYIIRAPNDAAVEFQDEEISDGTPLDFCSFIGMPPFTVTPPAPPNPGSTTGTPPPVGIRSYIYSAWFTAVNPDWSKNFPTDVSTFTRKSGGWFGITALFGTTTRYYWRGVFIYDAPRTADGTPSGAVNGNLSERLWIDMFPGNGGATPAVPAAPEREYDLTRDASAWPDGFGIGMRGAQAGIRQHNPSDYYGGTAQNIGIHWERLYVTWRKAGTTGNVLFWRCYNSAGANLRVELSLLPTGQMLVASYDAAGAVIIVGSTTPLVLNAKTKVDFICRQGIDIGAGVPGGGQLQIYFNGVAVMTAAFASGSGLNAIGFHARSEICTTAVGFDMELDLSFWMGARIPFTVVGLLKVPILTGLDFLNGSRPVLVKPVGDDASRANWTGDWRTATALFPRTANTGEALTSIVALARLALNTDALRAINALPGAMGMVAMVVGHHGWKGTNNGRLGYKLNGGADVFKAMGAPDLPSGEGGSNAARTWQSMMYSLSATAVFPTLTSLLLLREKGNDIVSSGTDHLSAVAEVIGTFADCDYPPNLDPTLRSPLPNLGHHNAPYPRSVWANAIAPPISPVTITAGDYSGTGTFVDLFFRNPIHFLWIVKKTNVGFSPTGLRWFSTILGAGLGGKKSPEPWVQPVQELDPQFTATATDNPATGIGLVPDRSAQVAAIVAIPNNLSLLDGDTDHKRDLLGIIVRTLNADNPGDGNNWGFLQKTDLADFVPADIIVWKPSREHFDVLTDTGATWIADGVLTNAAWVWLQVKDEGQQEQQTVVRIAGALEEVNKVGEDYSYIAVSDPGMRFMLNGAMTHSDAVLPLAHALIHPAFLAKGAFYFDTRPGTDVNLEMAFKGIGHAASETTKLNGAGTTQANALTFALGALTLGTGLASGTDTHLAYNLWRMDDASLDPNVAHVVQIGSYVGNGAGGTRDIPFTVLTGTKRPVFAVVVPHGAEAYVRTHGMSGGNSARMGGLHVATAITGGGVDKITVGVTLNVNLTVYEFFIIVGGTVAGNDGFSAAGIFEPVDPTTPTGGPWGLAPEDPIDPEDAAGDEGGDVAGAPGLGDDDIDSDLDTDCIPFTVRIFNDALSRIGISQRIVNAATENSEQADLCRRHYAHAIETTLRDFPWPFATRWAALSLLAGSTGSPANRDWTYSYRRPIDCVFERRLAVLRDGAVDPNPPPFQLSYDNTLQIGRILTNQAAPQLEYTARPLCTAGVGDPLFLDALTWLLAARVAASLTRIKDVIELCLKNYDAKIAKAFEVLRPGNPGPRTTVDPNGLDTAAGSAAANVAVINRGLIRIGARTIRNLDTEQSREGESARLIFEEELLSVLRDFPWSFATRYEAAPTLVGGTSTVPVNDDWTYSYRYPTDAVKIRRIVTEARRSRSEREPEMFRVGSDDVGGLVFCNRENPTFEYTARIADCVLRADALFRDAFGWRLAATLAPSLAQVDPQETEQLGRGVQDRPRERKPTEAQLRERASQAAWRQYYVVIEKARVADASEQQQDPDDIDADWIIGRE